MVAISKPFMAAPPPPPPTNQHVVDMLHQNDVELDKALSDLNVRTARRFIDVFDRMDTLEQSVKAIEQLLREFINKE